MLSISMPLHPKSNRECGSEKALPAHIHAAMSTDGVLTTYCAKGVIRRHAASRRIQGRASSQVPREGNGRY